MSRPGGASSSTPQSGAPRYSVGVLKAKAGWYTAIGNKMPFVGEGDTEEEALLDFQQKLAFNVRYAQESGTSFPEPGQDAGPYIKEKMKDASFVEYYAELVGMREVAVVDYPPIVLRELTAEEENGEDPS